MLQLTISLLFIGYTHNVPSDHRLKTTVPLVSDIRISLKFWYYVSLNTCCQNLGKKLESPENFGRNRGQTFKGSDREVSVLVLWQLSTSGFSYFLVKRINKRN